MSSSNDIDTEPQLIDVAELEELLRSETQEPPPEQDNGLEASFEGILQTIGANAKTTKEAIDGNYGSILRKVDRKHFGIIKHLLELPKDDGFQKYEPLLEVLLSYAGSKDFPTWKDADLGETILHLATRRNHKRLIVSICGKFQHGREGLAKQSPNGLNCLHIAAQRDPPDHFLVKLLLKLISSIDVAALPGVGGNTPLHFAVDMKVCQSGQQQVVASLLEASRNAMRHKNDQGLTPLQYHYNSRKAPGFSEDGNAVAKEIEHLLRVGCLRLDIDREEMREILYRDTTDRREFAFDLYGYEEIRADDLKHLSGHVHLEPVLKSVIIPDLVVHPTDSYVLKKQKTEEEEEEEKEEEEEEEREEEAIADEEVNNDETNPEGFLAEATTELPDCPGRIDYCWIFQWLREQLVTKILKVSVSDRQYMSHSDESIEWCLRGFDVEELEWNKLDICSTTITRATPRVRNLTLHCSGNNAVLRSWIYPGGLAELESIESLNLKILQGLESIKRTVHQATQFKTMFLEQRRQWCLKQHPQQASTAKQAQKDKPVKLPTCAKHQVRVDWNIVGSDGKTVKSNSDNEDDKRAEAEKQEWIQCMEKFAAFAEGFRKDMKEAGMAPPQIKVALIDDGVDGLHADLSKMIDAGQTFSARSKHEYNSYFKSTRGHGTIMAMLIRKICRNARLYVAKLNEERTGRHTTSITAESAVKAVNWAVSHQVHLISMSWTISQATDKATLEELTTAVQGAIKAGILVFCSISDQGPRDALLYPAACDSENTFLIGSATISGQAWRWNGPGEVDYILPGTDLDVQIGDELFDSRLRHLCESGSSLATALASGLAALILDCVAMCDPPALERFRHDAKSKMKAAFDSINKQRYKNEDNYLRVWDTFGRALEDEAQEDVLVMKWVVDTLMARVRQLEGVVEG